MSPLLRDYRPASADPRTNLPAPLPGTDLVEAETAEEAIAEVHRRHGRRARIVAAEKVRRGGISGFFAREFVQLRVEFDDPEPPAVRRVPAPPAPAPSVPGPPVLAPPVPAEVVPPDGPSTGHAATDARLASGTLATPAPSRVTTPADAAPRNPLLAALDGADGPPGETFGEMLDRKAAAAGLAPAGGGVTRAVQAMTRATDDREEGFGASLRAAVGQDQHTDRRDQPGAPAQAADEGATVADDVRGRSEVPMRGAASLVGASIRAGGAASLVVDRLEVAQARVETAERVETVEDLVVADVEPAAAPEQPDASTPPAADPLPARHEAMRQLRARTEVRSASDDEAPRTPPSGRWSEDALARVGVPPSLVAAAVAFGPTDDIGWVTAIARAVEPLCRPLAVDAEVVVGRRAGDVAAHLGAQRASLDRRAAPGGSCALSSARTPDARRWLAEERRGRTLHLVAGGTGWRDWLLDGPTVVSWTRVEDLPDALDAAARFGLTLGWALEGDGARRASPVDVAVSLRTRVVGP